MLSQEKKCPFCGGKMVFHIFGKRVYWLCENCKEEMMIPKIAEMMVGHIK